MSTVPSSSLFDLPSDEDDDASAEPSHALADDAAETDGGEGGEGVEGAEGGDEAEGGDDELEFSDDEEFNAVVEAEPEKNEMSAPEKERSERNRLKALALKKSRLMVHPYSSTGAKPHKSDQPKLLDSGGGFFLEEGGEEEEARVRVIHEDSAPILPFDQPNCDLCQVKFNDSYLFRKFDYSVCDKCRDMSKDGDHELITKTEAKTTFLIKDHDFEESEHGKPLRFMTRKNPHNPLGGEMKLYLRLQVEERAIQVWGSEEVLEKELEGREERKMELKARKYTKKMKVLRMAVRSSLYKKDLSSHTHQYKDEVYHEDKDEYSQTCGTCGHINRYEKM